MRPFASGNIDAELPRGDLVAEHPIVHGELPPPALRIIMGLPNSTLLTGAGMSQTTSCDES
eukprot:608407-Amphidinium_carterae.1